MRNCLHVYVLICTCHVQETGLEIKYLLLYFGKQTDFNGLSTMMFWMELISGQSTKKNFLLLSESNLESSLFLSLSLVRQVRNSLTAAPKTALHKTLICIRLLFIFYFHFYTFWWEDRREIIISLRVYTDRECVVCMHIVINYTWMNVILCRLRCLRQVIGLYSSFVCCTLHMYVYALALI